MTPPVPAGSPRSVWGRSLLMLIMGLAFQLASTLLCLLALVQLALWLVNRHPNLRLMAFARALGLYLRQIAEFVGFAADAPPFPFADWPSGAGAELAEPKPWE